MTDILTMREYSHYSLDELVDMIKSLEQRIKDLEEVQLDELILTEKYYSQTSGAED